MPTIDEQSDLFASLTWPPDSRTLSLDGSQAVAQSQSQSTNKTTTELPAMFTLLLPMMNGVESGTSNSTPLSQAPTTNQSKQPAIMFTSNNGVIDDPLIQSLAAEQAASAHNYDLLSHRNKRVRKKKLLFYLGNNCFHCFAVGSSSTTLWRSIDTSFKYSVIAR